jgi:hypothetical protein
MINFNLDTPGSVPNGYSPVGHPAVTLTDTLGADLTIGNFSPQSNGLGLGVFGDDASRLQIDFAGGISALAIAFGNDDPGWTSPGDRAWLEMFNGAASLGTSSVDLNRDDVLNQVISWSGPNATRALFWFGDGSGSPIGLIEVVDDIEYTLGQGASIPEPGTFALVGLGAAAVALFRRR